MSLYISAQIASEHHAQLIREAARWRRRREAQRAVAAEVDHAVVPSVYCRRAAGHAVRGAA